MPTDYQKGKIYKLWSPSKNLVYYGSTTESLSSRLAKHSYTYKNQDKYKNKYSAFKVLECDDYKLELVKLFPCNNRQQLLKEEGEYIKNNECVNKCVAGRTTAEYSKQYRIDNADKIKEYHKIYNERKKQNNEPTP
jgi:hypothetical protein